jgi:hypothetical protein
MICFKCSWQNSAGLMEIIHSLGRGWERFLSSKDSDTLVLLGKGSKKNLLIGFEGVVAYFTTDFGIENERDLGLK